MNNKEQDTKKKFKISKKSDPHKLLGNLSDKMNLKRSNKYVAFSNLSITVLHMSYEKESPKKNKFKLWDPSGITFEFLDRSYSLWDIQSYFQYIIRKH